MRLALPFRMILPAALLWGSAAVTCAQQPPPAAHRQQQQREEAKPVVVPAGALKLGAQLEAAGRPDFLKWARGYARRGIQDARTPPEDHAVQHAVDTRYSKAPASARAAGVFLLWYLAYQQAARDEEFGLARVQDMERDLQRLEDDLIRIRNTPVPLQQVAAAREAEERAEGRRDDARRLLDLHQRSLDALNARANLCLERLAALYPLLRDADPAEIRRLK